MVGVLVAGLLAAACVLGGRNAGAAPDEAPEVSAERLGDATQEGSILELLDPTERAALERSQITGMRPEHQKPAEPESENFGDTVGKVGVSIASVALSLAAVAAPFFLF